MNRILSIFDELVVRPLSDAYRAVVALLPNLLLALAIVLVGWFAALVLRKLITKLLRALGFNVLAEKLGLTKFLKRGGVSETPARIVGLIIYWVIIFSMLIAVFQTLNLTAASAFLIDVLSYIPKIIVSIVILWLGIFLGRFLGNLADRSSKLADLPFHRLLGNLTRYAVILVAAYGVLGYLRLTSALISGSFTLVFLVVPALLILGLFFGGHTFIASLLAGRFLTRDFKAGDRIAFDSLSGTVKSIDVTTTKIQTEEGEVIVPNAVLSQKIIRRPTGEQGNLEH